ncbi:hypothetical protein PO909_016937, partial [Leuciscus waleckii]
APGTAEISATSATERSPPHYESCRGLNTHKKRESAVVNKSAPSILSTSACSSFRNQRPSCGHTETDTSLAYSSSMAPSIQGTGGGRMEGSKPTSVKSSWVQAW